MSLSGPIGVFDSGYGGLTILSELQEILPQYDYCYLGDNSRAPYGSRSFDIVYKYTLQAVEELFSRGCNLVILACNTASAKALRSIQQNDLPRLYPNKRVLGIIRPTAEIVGSLSETKHIGIFGTVGTIQSESYPIEIHKQDKNLVVTSEACPMWVPLVENMEWDKPGSDYFVKQHIDNLLKADPEIDTIVLGCTHYPLLFDKIRQYLPTHVKLVRQGKYVAHSLVDYLNRHPEMESVCTKNGVTQYLTTESAEKFRETGSTFLNKEIEVERILLG